MEFSVPPTPKRIWRRETHQTKDEINVPIALSAFRDKRPTKQSESTQIVKPSTNQTQIAKRKSNRHTRELKVRVCFGSVIQILSFIKVDLQLQSREEFGAIG